MINIFSRYERKFLLTLEQKQNIDKFLKAHMSYDIYSPSGETYGIYNYYLDTEGYEVIRHSIAKPAYKHKIRMRYYDDHVTHDTQVFLEIKSKADKRVNKRRIQLSLEDANKYLIAGKKPVLNDYLSHQIFNEIDYLIKKEGLSPKTYIEYQRIAYIDTNSDLRITIDSNLWFQDVEYNLGLKGIRTPLIPDDLFLMEVKTGQGFPLWLVQYLSSQSLFSQSFSKYGRAFQHYLQGGSVDDLTIYNKLY